MNVHYALVVLVIDLHNYTKADEEINHRYKYSNKIKKRKYPNKLLKPTPMWSKH
jgi:hypothetical protein